MMRARSEILRTLAEALEQAASAVQELAELDEREARRSPTGWVSQRSSPLGKGKHLALWHRLRDEGADGVRASGKLRLIRQDVFDAALAHADTVGQRRRRCLPPEGARVDLAHAFGVFSEPGSRRR